MALVCGAISDWLIAAEHLTITNGRKIFVAFGNYKLYNLNKFSKLHLNLFCFLFFFSFYHFRSIASVFTGVFIIAASYAECDKLYVVAYFTISVAFQGVPGVAINSLDLSPNYAGILMGIGGAVTSITGILVPYMVGVVAPNVSSVHCTHSHIHTSNM